jgi:adenosylhomocysteine nucleosidase
MAQVPAEKRRCSLLLFLATPAEKEALKQAAQARKLPFEKIKDAELGEQYHWLGPVGNESGVIAVRPSRVRGKVVMGPLGRLGSAARAIHFRIATGAQGIVQLGMAFGIDTKLQRPCDVLVSTSLIPYDNREVRPVRARLLRRMFCGETYTVEYPHADRQWPRPSLVELFRREQRRGGRTFAVHFCAMLSGAARVQSGAFRDELVRTVPAGEDRIVGGEMEGVGLLAASLSPADPIWCVVKGISDFADESRDTMIEKSRDAACMNAAEFVLSSLVNDARD